MVIAAKNGDPDRSHRTRRTSTTVTGNRRRLGHKNVAPRPCRLVKQRRRRWRPNKTVLATCGIERLALIMQRSTCSFSIFAVVHFLTGTAQQMLSSKIGHKLCTFWRQLETLRSCLWRQNTALEKLTALPRPFYWTLDKGMWRKEGDG